MGRPDRTNGTVFRGVGRHLSPMGRPTGVDGTGWLISSGYTPAQPARVEQHVTRRRARPVPARPRSRQRPPTRHQTTHTPQLVEVIERRRQRPRTATAPCRSHPRVHRPLEQAVGSQAGGDRPGPDGLLIRPPRSGSLPAPVRTSTLRLYRRRASSPAFRPAGGVPARTAAHRVRLAWLLRVCRPPAATRGPRCHRPELSLPPTRPACAGPA